MKIKVKTEKKRKEKSSVRKGQNMSQLRPVTSQQVGGGFKTVSKLIQRSFRAVSDQL